ncbi:MAG: DNA primase [Provencibacterium sp.]|nr:DNA primase [Provencibacterium sp.]
MIPETFIQELRFHIDIEQLVSSYVRLQRRGRVAVGLCPFHNEKTPSFTVYPESQSFYCFGCGAGGDAITFIRRAENLDYPEAVRFLADRAGLRVPDEGSDDAGARLRLRILECNRAAARFYYDTLVSPAGARGLHYLRERALSDATIRRFGLGYAPAEWNALTHHLHSLGFSEEEMLAARVAASSKKDGRAYDLFRDRVIFPIIDLRGGVIGFGGRILEGEGPKYLNSPDTPVFKKSRNLFALNRAKSSKQQGLLLAEGYMDVIALHQAGFDHAIATLGTSLTAEQTQLISRYAREVTIAYDSDGAGQKATRRALSLFQQTGVKVRVLKIEGAKDPDEYMKKFGPARFRLLLQNCANATEFEINRLRQAYDLETADGKVSFLGEFAALMASIRNPVERDVYIKKTAGELAVSPDAVLQMVASNLKRRRGGEEKKQQRDMHMYVGAGAHGALDPERERNLKYALAEERIIALLLQNPDYYEYIAERIGPEQFVTGKNREVFSRLCERLRAGQSVELFSLSGVLNDEEMSLVSGLLACSPTAHHSREEAEDCIRVLRGRENERSSNEVAAMDEEQLRDYFQKIASEKKQRL